MKRDPLLVLLNDLRVNPNEASIRKIVEFVNNCCGEYYNVPRAIQNILARPLTTTEKALVARLP